MKLQKSRKFYGGGQLRNCLACASLVVLAVARTMAADGTWTASGTDLDWWNPANWQGGTVGEGVGASVNISTSGDMSIYLTNSISFENVGVSAGGKKTIGGTGSIVLAETSGGDGLTSFNAGADVNMFVDVPVSGDQNIVKRGWGSLYLDGRTTITGTISVVGGLFASDWTRVADTPSPTTGDNNIAQNILPVTELKVSGAGTTVRFNPRISRTADQSFTVSLSSDSPYVTVTSTSNVSAGQQVEAEGGVLAAGTFVRRVVNTTTLELSAKPLSTATATITVKASPFYCSRQNLTALTVQAPFTLGLNPGFQMYVQKLAGEGGSVSLDRNGRLIVGDTREFSGTVTFWPSANLSCENPHPLSDSLPVTDSLLFRMDASDASTLTLDGDRVTAWRTVTGAGDITATPAGVTTPVLLPNALNGKPVVDMGPTVDNGGMAWSAPVSGIRTFFVVIGSQAGGGTLLGADGALSGYCFARGHDPFASRGFRNPPFADSYPLTRDHAVFRHSSQSATEAGNIQFWVNGSRGNFISSLSGDYDLVSGTVGTDGAASAFARVADGVHTRTGSEGGQRLAEVILYSRVLSETERESVEAYLRRKWFGETPRGWGCGYVERVVDKATHNTVGAPVTDWPMNGGRVRIGTFEQSAVCDYLTVDKLTLEMDRAAFAKKLRLYNGGKVEFTARQTSATCPVPGVALHVDANCNVETGTGGKVLFWGGVDGAGYACTNRQGAGDAPTLVANGLNGMPVVDFGAASSTQHLVWHTNIMVRALFYVMKAENKFVSFCGSVCPEMDVVDHFTRYNNNLAYIYDPSVQMGARGGIVRLDGYRILNPQSYNLVTNSFKLLGHTLDCPAMANAFGCGALEKTNLRAQRTGGLQLAEVLIFDRKLSDDESLAIQAYLRYKWFGETLAGFTAPGEPFVVPGLGAGGTGSPSVTIRGTAPVTIGTMFGETTITLSAPDGAVVTVPGTQGPLALSNACLAASANVNRGVYINAGSTNSLVSAGGTFAAGALVYGTLKVNGDTAVDIGTLYLYDGGTLLLAPDSDACAGITSCSLDVRGTGTVRLEVPASRLAQPQGRYAVATGSYVSAASKANMEGWDVTSNLNPAKWNVTLKVTDGGVAVTVAPKGCTIIFR